MLENFIYSENAELVQLAFDLNLIPDEAIVFTGDTKLIMTHGTVYDTQIKWSILSDDNEEVFRYTLVDLGLPSGKKWATCNVGASKPEEHGLFYAWGETDGYIVTTEGSLAGPVSEEVLTASVTTMITDANGNNTDKLFTQNDYKFYNNGYTKYNTSDNKTRLELTDDIAYLTDNNCRIPTSKECQELLENTTQTYVEDYNNSGVPGWILTKKSEPEISSLSTEEPHIFIPYAILVLDGETEMASIIMLETSDLANETAYTVWGNFGLDDLPASIVFPRYGGFNIRPISPIDYDPDDIPNEMPNDD